MSTEVKMSLSFLDVRYRPLELSITTDSYSRVADVENGETYITTNSARAK